MMEQFFDDCLCHGGDGFLLRVGECCFVETRLQFGVGYLSKLLVQCFNRGIDLKDLQLVVESFGFFRDNLFCVDCFLLSVFEVRGDNGFQIIYIVEERRVEFAHIRIDVAWDSDIDEEHISVLPFPHNVDERLALDEIVGSIGGANDNIGINKEIEITIVGKRGSLKLLCNFYCPLVCPIGNNHVGDPVCNEMLCCELTHLACPDNRDGFAFECVENLFGEFDGSVTDGNRTGGDCRFGSDAFANAEGFREKAIENRSRAAC